MDKSRDNYIAEIARLENAILKTQSKHLQADYRKAVSRMRKELRTYDRFKRKACLGI